MADPKRDEPATPPDPMPAERVAPGTAAPESANSVADAAAAKGPLDGVPRVVSLIVLIAVVLLIGVLFFRVMSSFLAPLFLATVLAVVFQPLHQWSLGVCRDRRYYAATLTTTLVSLLVLAPTAYFAWRAFDETRDVVAYVSDKENRTQLLDSIGDQANQLERWLRERLGQGDPVEATDPAPTDASASESTAEPGRDAPPPDADAAGGAPVGQGSRFPALKRLSGEALLYLRDNALAWGAVGVSALVSFLFGLGVMIFALYYFLADGPAMLDALVRLSPMDDTYERELLDQFSEVSRAVVVATILTAIVQGLLGGIGYFFVMDAGSPVFLLTVLTAALAIVPFIGATAVWAPVAAWVFFLQEDGFWPGIGLAVWGFCVVSTVDNFLKPYILHGQSNLHPLLALLSVLGGLQLLGPIGILIGPLAVAFLQTLLGMLKKELDGFRAAAADS